MKKLIVTIALLASTHSFAYEVTDGLFGLTVLPTVTAWANTVLTFASTLEVSNGRRYRAAKTDARDFLAGEEQTVLLQEAIADIRATSPELSTVSDEEIAAAIAVVL